MVWLHFESRQQAHRFQSTLNAACGWECRSGAAAGTQEVAAPTIDFVVTFRGFSTDQFGAAQQAAYSASIQQAVTGECMRSCMGGCSRFNGGQCPHS